MAAGLPEVFAAFRRFPSASRLALQLAGHVVDAHVVHLSPADAAALVRVGLRVSRTLLLLLSASMIRCRPLTD